MLDVDTGIDDALAIIMALRSPELKVEAIATVSGNAPVEECLANTLLVLELLECDVPVARGAERPLSNRPFSAPEVHGADGLGGARARWKRSSRRAVSEPAWELLLELTERYRGEIVLITLGPQTNLALALERDPSLAARLKGLISMGGAFRAYGNTTTVAEFNMYVDPEAAKMVLASGLRPTFVPLDVTESVRFTRRQLERQSAARRDKISRFVLDILPHYMAYHKAAEGFDGCYLHDPMAVSLAIAPDMFETIPARVDIETRGELTRGMTVARLPLGGRGASAPTEANAEVALRVDARRFLALFRSRIWKR